MDLNDHTGFAKIDTQNMQLQIDRLPDQLLAGYNLGKTFTIRFDHKPNAIVLAGMGGSAIGGDLFSAFVSDKSAIPFFVHRNYGLPAWVKGDDRLIIVSSHSGNTEEALSAFDTAIESKCQVLVITTGGKLEDKARNENIPVWKFEHQGQPRAAIGYSFGLLASLAVHLGMIADMNAGLKNAVDAMKNQQAEISAVVPVKKNPAKRLAGQMVGRSISIYGADHLAPVARRWKTQVNELAKTWSQYDEFPEMNHNAIAGGMHPESVLENVFAIFLVGFLQNPRNRKRIELTRNKFMQEGINTDIFEAKGLDLLTQMWTAIHFGDYLLYYLAMLYEVDPTPIDAISWLKKSLI